MDAGVVSLEQLQEYERQLADVNELLEATPEDAALLSLKSDLEELLALTKASLVAVGDANDVVATTTTTTTRSSSSLENKHDSPPNEESELAGDKESLRQEDFATATAPHAAESTEQQQQQQIPELDANIIDGQQQSVKKKSKKKMAIKEFEIPSHLMIHEADTEAEKNRKRRAIKALKNKYREKKKEVETEMKQQSWQSFQQKTLKRKNSNDHNASIFATQEGEHAARVGVVSTASRGMTEFAERKRHKQI